TMFFQRGRSARVKSCQNASSKSPYFPGFLAKHFAVDFYTFPLLRLGCEPVSRFLVPTQSVGTSDDTKMHDEGKAIVLLRRVRRAVVVNSIVLFTDAR